MRACVRARVCVLVHGYKAQHWPTQPTIHGVRRFEGTKGTARAEPAGVNCLLSASVAARRLEASSTGLEPARLNRGAPGQAVKIQMAAATEYLARGMLTVAPAGTWSMALALSWKQSILVNANGQPAVPSSVLALPPAPCAASIKKFTGAGIQNTSPSERTQTRVLCAPAQAWPLRPSRAAVSAGLVYDIHSRRARSVDGRHREFFDRRLPAGELGAYERESIIHSAKGKAGAGSLGCQKHGSPAPKRRSPRTYMFASFSYCCLTHRTAQSSL